MRAKTEERFCASISGVWREINDLAAETWDLQLFGKSARCPFLVRVLRTTVMLFLRLVPTGTSFLNGVILILRGEAGSLL